MIEPHQSFDHQRLWAELLWVPALAFNLCGDMAQDLALADEVVHYWWPDAPGRVSAIRFAHSPGRLDPTYLSSLRAFDVALVLDLGAGRQGVIGVDVRYWDNANRETPKPENLSRYRQVAERAGVFAAGALGSVEGRSDLCEIWLEHLLVHSMLQYEGAAWAWGRFVVIHPAGNVAFEDACARYRRLLDDQTTFTSVTLEQLLDDSALPESTVAALRRRYLPD